MVEKLYPGALTTDLVGVETLQLQAYKEQNAIPSMPGVSGVTTARNMYDQGQMDQFLMFPSLAAADFVNTIASSVGIIDENFLSEQLRNNLPAAYQYYVANKDPINRKRVV